MAAVAIAPYIIRWGPDGWQDMLRRNGPLHRVRQARRGAAERNFVLKDWPPATPPCVVPGSTTPPARPMDRRKAQEICGRIKDVTLRMQCTLDVTATGDIGFFQTYQTTERLRSAIAPPP